MEVVVKDVCTIMAGHCPEEVPGLDTNNHSYILHVKIDDVDSYHKTVTEAGGEIANELGDRPWGFREFTVRSNEGHRITFAQRLAE